MTETRATQWQRIAEPRELGIGMRLSIHPHCDDFVPVILGALDDAHDDGLTEGLHVVTDEVSTYIGALESPAEERLGLYAARVIEAASRRSAGAHTVSHVLLSRGCPGELGCDLAMVRLPHVPPVSLAPTGVKAVGQWSLYPLIDGASRAHMPYIEGAIREAQVRGVASAAAHYATMLRGDIAEVLSTAVDGWASVGSEIPHVVSHLTVSVGSPSSERSL